MQLLSVLAAAAFSGVGTFVLLHLVRGLVGLRASSNAESIGIDITEHAEHAYQRETLIGKRTHRINPAREPITAG